MHKTHHQLLVKCQSNLEITIWAYSGPEASHLIVNKATTITKQIAGAVKE